MADAITDAHALYKDSLEALRDQRLQIAQDLAFSDPSDPQQWDDTIKRARETDPGGSRPCLVHDQTGQYVANVAGQVEQRPPALHAIPVDGGADKKVAEQMDGFFRHVEHTSRAQQHYARALTSAARAGVGYLIVRPEYVDRAMGYQEPRITCEPDPLKVVFDPWSVELDGSDATDGFVLTSLSQPTMRRMYGDKVELVSFTDDDRRFVRDDRESVVIADYWHVENKSTNMLIVSDLAKDPNDEFSIPEDQYWEQSKRADFSLQVAQDNGRPRTYTDKSKCVKWSRMSGAAVLTKETEYPATGIGIVPVYGYVGWANGRMKYCGIARRARAPQQSYNYHISELHAYMATAPRSPWLASKRAVRGVEAIWDRASVDTRAWMPWNDVDEDGQIAPPMRSPVSTNLANHQQGAEQALKDIQASIGMYQANLGAPSNEQSGVAIDARKEQGEASTAHFPSHLAAALGQVGKLIMEMVPRLIDTKRQIRILGIDETPGQVTVDPGQKEAMVQTPQGLSINPNVGRYDVRVVVGASFTTQRSQAQQAFTEMMRAAPQLMPAIAPLWAQTLDVPHADKLAQVLTAVAPPEVKAVLQPEADKQVNPAELMAKITQMGQALEEAIQHAKDAQMEADELRSAQEVKEREVEVKERELDIKRYDSETKRLQITGANEQQIQAIVQQMIVSMLQSPSPLPGDTEPMEGPGMDGAPMHEMAEGEAPEPVEMGQMGQMEQAEPMQ